MGETATIEPPVKTAAAPEPAIETEVTPAPAIETSTSTTAIEAPKEQAQARPVGGVEAYRKLKEEALSGKVPEGLAEAAPVETPTETPTSTETPATETPPVETPEPPAAEDHTPDRIRLKGLKDGHLVAAANEIARAENIPFAEAFARVAPKPAAAAETTAQTNGPQLRSREAVQKDMTASNTELDAAADALDNMEPGAAKRQREAQKKSDSLKDELGQIDVAEFQAEEARENQARTKFNTDVATSQAQTVEYWPEAKDVNSELSKKMIELADAYEKDPNLKHMVSEADAPFYFASLAAKELKLLPANLRSKTPATPIPAKASTSPTALKPAPVTQRAVGTSTPPAATPASGDARTTGETTPDPLGVDKANNPHEYHKLLSRLTGKRY